jgi:hypothetical protein
MEETIESLNKQISELREIIKELRLDTAYAINTLNNRTNNLDARVMGWGSITEWEPSVLFYDTIEAKNEAINCEKERRKQEAEKAARQVDANRRRVETRKRNAELKKTI